MGLTHGYMGACDFVAVSKHMLIKFTGESPVAVINGKQQNLSCVPAVPEPEVRGPRGSAARESQGPPLPHTGSFSSHLP